MINIVKIISTELTEAGRRIVKVLRYGKSDVQTPVQSAPFGSDSNPPADIRGVYTNTGNKGDNVIIGYINVNQIAEIGENRLFSTDEDGNLIFEMRLRNDGTVEIGGSVDNLVRFSKLKIEFDILKTDLNSLVSAFNTHVHATAAPGPPVPPTPVPSVIPATPSIADISPAKIDELKSS